LDTSKFDIIGDSYYEIETGEYAGPVDGWLGDELKTEDDVLLALQRLLKYETELKAEQLAMQSVVERYKSMVKDKERKVQWLQSKYGAQIAAFSKTQLTGKSKTWKCPWGQVAWRTSSPTFSILDEEKAAYVIPLSLDAIKVEHKVYKSKIPKEVQLTLVEEYPELFSMTEASENYSVKALTASEATDES
jgi:phage host-nuclease inhibitor protein Gam